MKKVSGSALAYLLAFLSGACILALEILGARVIGPYYGMTIYLWSALITVTLSALAIGYFLGGRMADRDPALKRLSSPMALAGFWVLSTGWIKGPILGLTVNLGLRYSVLAAAVILFALPLVALGTVGPFLVRAQSNDLKRVGRTTGNLYAVSTLGGVAGALLAGYYLMPVLGLQMLMIAVGVLLLGLAALLWLVGMGWSAGWSALAIMPVAVLAGWLWPGTGFTHNMNGSIHRETSPYADIQVTEHDNIRRLYLDGQIQNTLDKRDGQSYSPHVLVMEVGAALYADPGSLLLIGLGAGSLPRRYSALGWRVEAVELDPVVIRAAYAHFGLDTSHASVFKADGRQYLRLTGETFDLIVFDAFCSGLLPSHLLTLEAVSLARDRLNSGGVIMYHVPVMGRSDKLLLSLAATVRERFEHVVALPIADASARPASMLLLASDRELVLARPDLAGAFSSLVWSRRFQPDRGWDVATDDKNDIDLHSERLNRAIRESVLQ
jgi:spermidine synthase